MENPIPSAIRNPCWRTMPDVMVFPTRPISRTVQETQAATAGQRHFQEEKAAGRRTETRRGTGKADVPDL